MLYWLYAAKIRKKIIRCKYFAVFYYKKIRTTVVTLVPNNVLPEQTIVPALGNTVSSERHIAAVELPHQRCLLY